MFEEVDNLLIQYKLNYDCYNLDYSAQQKVIGTCDHMTIIVYGHTIEEGNRKINTLALRAYAALMEVEEVL